MCFATVVLVSVDEGDCKSNFDRNFSEKSPFFRSSAMQMCFCARLLPRPQMETLEAFIHQTRLYGDSWICFDWYAEKLSKYVAETNWTSAKWLDSEITCTPWYKARQLKLDCKNYFDWTIVKSWKMGRCRPALPRVDRMCRLFFFSFLQTSPDLFAATVIVEAPFPVTFAHGVDLCPA